MVKKRGNGAIHQFNVMIEKESRGLGLGASYVGSRSYGLNYTVSINKPRPSLVPFTQDRRPYPQFVGVSLTKSKGRQSFDSRQLEVRRKMARGLMFDAHWTLSSNLANYLNLSSNISMPAQVARISSGSWNRVIQRSLRLHSQNQKGVV